MFMRGALFVLFLCLSGIVFGAEEQHGFGFQPSLLVLTLDDPAGETDSLETLVPLSLFYSLGSGRDLRYLAEATYVEGQVDAAVDRVGEGVTSSIIGISIQRRFRIARNWKPWLGGGVSYFNNRFENRHTIDSEGFLAEHYGNRSEDAFSATLTAASYWDVHESFDLGVHLVADLPYGSELRRVGVGVAVLF